MVERRCPSLSIGLGGIAAWTLSALIGCTGSIDEPSGSARGSVPGPHGAPMGSGSDPSPSDPGLSGGNTPPSSAEFHPAPSTLRRLTVAQYQNSVRDLLGPQVTITTDLEADTPLNGFASIGAARIALSPHAT